ncbi:MAG TPA: SseB family protein [Polyangiales bacterium]|nr:SseB family protein [Polyangiales bacterium]
MVSGGTGSSEPGVVEVRRLLARAVADDDARSEALDAVCERSVIAATVSGSGDGLRTLTNANGDKAMPLFTGKDALQAAANRFGWSSKDGAPAMRELSAREAMQSALVQGVQFVVFDVGADHCVEFARDEVALMLAAKQARQRPAAASPKPSVSPKPSTSAKPSARPKASPSAKPSMSPKAGPSPKPAAPPSGRGPRVPTAERRGLETAPARPGAQGSLPVSAVTSPGFVFDPGAARTSALPVPPRLSGSPPAVAGGAGAVAPRPSPGPMSDSSSSVTMPSIPAVQYGFGPPSIRPPHSDGVAPLPSVATLPGASVELLPAADPVPGAAVRPPPIDLAAAMDSLAPDGPAPSPDGQESIAPRAPRVKPTGQSAVRPPSLSAPVDPIEPIAPALDPTTGLAFAPTETQPEADSAVDALPAVGQATAVPAPVPAATRVVPPPPAATEKASLKQKAIKGMDDVAGRSLKTAAKALAAILGSESASERRAAVAQAKPAPEATEDDAPPDDEPDLPDGALRPLQIGLSDALQSAIADALRAYPEVEWACEVSDGSEVPVVGVRVSPSFTTRVAEIEVAVMTAASAREVSLRVLLLKDPAVMRDARAQGNTFFPWRKRPNRK